MGGDKAPAAIVSGAVEAARVSEGQYEIVLVGDKQEVEKHLHHHPFIKGCPLSVIHASQKIEMDEAPAMAMRKKPDSSIAVATRLHSEGKVDAVVSAGNTGAVLAAALFMLKRKNMAVHLFLELKGIVLFLMEVQRHLPFVVQLRKPWKWSKKMFPIILKNRYRF